MKLAFVAQHTDKKFNVRLVPMVLSDCINMSARNNVAQLLKV